MQTQINYAEAAARRWQLPVEGSGTIAVVLCHTVKLYPESELHEALRTWRERCGDDCRGQHGWKVAKD